MEVYTVKEIAELLKLSEGYIRSQIKGGYLKNSMKFGCRGGHRISKEALEKWQNSKNVKS